jgi:imidazoleglycerol-phosphate dehydratase
MSRPIRENENSPMSRSVQRTRHTKETELSVALDVDGTGTVDVSTGLPFFDHMLGQLGKHGGFDLAVHAQGDLDVDAHHTVEDTGILLGEAFREALGDKAGVRRFASISVPLDEALVSVAVDLSGRPYCVYNVDFAAVGASTNLIGTPGFDPQLAEHFFESFAHNARLTLHVHLVCGRNTHHIIEATHKALARALRDAVRIEGGEIPSTKGTLGS